MKLHVEMVRGGVTRDWIRTGLTVALSCLSLSLFTGCASQSAWSPPKEGGELSPLPKQPYTPPSTPTPDTLRHLAQQRGFLIGTGVQSRLLSSASEPLYREVLAREYNVISPEWELKFRNIQPEQGQYRFAPADAAMEFAQKHGMAVRGHALVWHYEIPDWLAKEPNRFTNAEVARLLREHIHTVVGRYKGKIAYWDVVNEPFAYGKSTLRSSFWSYKLGQEYIANSLRWAHEADPQAKLFVNETDINGIDAKSDALYELVKKLRADGVPLHGVGMQIHLSVNRPIDFEGFAANIRRFSDLGVEVHITEMDVSLYKATGTLPELLQRQAEMYRKVTDACLRAPNCTALVTWGFTDRHTWLNNYQDETSRPLPFDQDYLAKPAYEALRQSLAGQ